MLSVFLLTFLCCFRGVPRAAETIDVVLRGSLGRTGSDTSILISIVTV